MDRCIYTVTDDPERFVIHNKLGNFVSSVERGTDNHLYYEFTTNRHEAALFDRVSAMISPIVDKRHKPAFWFERA